VARSHPTGIQKEEDHRMGFVKEFKEFALKGNVLDMAIGILIGAAFGKVVSSFVADVMTPPIGLISGNKDFTDYRLVLRPATETAEAVTLNYGQFFTIAIDFAIIAFAIFLLVKVVNAAQRKEERKAAPPPGPTREEVLLTEIRDLLEARA
jgi:large conductance mechanosensitive channel